jgi:hypothetical protein
MEEKKELTLQEKASEFEKEYLQLTEKYKVAYRAVPYLVARDDGTWSIKLRTEIVEKK